MHLLKKINVFFVQRPSLQPFRFGEVVSCQSDHILYKEFKLANMKPTCSTISSPFWKKYRNNNYLPKWTINNFLWSNICSWWCVFGKCKWCRDPPIAPFFNQWRFQPFPSNFWFKEETLIEGWPGQRVGSMMPSLWRAIDNQLCSILGVLHKFHGMEVNNPHIWHTKIQLFSEISRYSASCMLWGWVKSQRKFFK